MDKKTHNLLISQRIKELALEKNISINELAKRADLRQSTINNILNAEKNPTIPTLYKICKGFNISIVEFFDFLPYKKI